MLEEVIRELTARNNDELTNSKGLLAWVKRIEVQQVQAAILNDIIKLHQFNKINIASKTKGRQDRQALNATFNRQLYRYCSGIHVPQQYPAYGKTCPRCRKTGHYKKVCRSKRDHAVHELQVEMVQDSQDEEIETVSINSVYLNKNQSLITAHLEMQVGKNTVEIPYKIDTDSGGNIMPLYIFKKLFKDMTEEQLEKSIKNNIKLKTYKGMHITQLATCVVSIKFKNLKKCCIFFVVLGNGQVLLGMPDTAALNIINLSIDSIQAEITSCKINREHAVHSAAEGCTNTDAGAINRQDANGQNDQNNSNNLINYFFCSSNIMADKRRSSKMTQRIHDRFGHVLNDICYG